MPATHATLIEVNYSCFQLSIMQKYSTSILSNCISTPYPNLVPRALFPGLAGGAGKGPGIGRPIRHFDWLIDLGNSCKKMAR